MPLHAAGHFWPALRLLQAYLTDIMKTTTLQPAVSLVISTALASGCQWTAWVSRLAVQHVCQDLHIVTEIIKPHDMLLSWHCIILKMMCGHDIVLLQYCVTIIMGKYHSRYWYLEWQRVPIKSLNIHPLYWSFDCDFKVLTSDIGMAKVTFKSIFQHCIPYRRAFFDVKEQRLKSGTISKNKARISKLFFHQYLVLYLILSFLISASKIVRTIGITK
jgi:hypothetical protein